MSNFIVHNEDILGSINGETPGGEQMQLGEDVLVYIKLVDVEQPTLNRLRASKEISNLYNEIDVARGKVYLGELEAVKAELHASIDKMFAAIVAYRKKQKDEKSN